MGVSVANSAMATGNWRTSYGRPYWLARAGGNRSRVANQSAAADDTNSDSSSEELRYGPGIVSRLKNRYISMALRESAGRRPTLRRVTSLEHLLDKEGAFANGSTKDSYILEGRGRGCKDSMKRAKSVGDLASGRLPPPDGSRGPPVQRSRKDVRPIAAEKVVVVEQCDVAATADAQQALHTPAISRPAPMPDPPPKEEVAGTLPPPDTVRTVKRLFEPSSRRAAGPRVLATGETKLSSGRGGAVDRSARVNTGRRLSPGVRPPTMMSRPSTTKPTVKQFVSDGGGGSSPSSLPSLSSARRSATASLPVEAVSRTVGSWSQLRSQESAPPEDRGPALPHSPTRPVKKPPLSRESSCEPLSPTSSPVRRQVGIIKPTRKAEHRDEFNRCKNTLNHVKNSVVEKEIAVIGTEYLKLKDLEGTREITKLSTLNGVKESSALQHSQDAPPPALPPRKALVVEPKKPLSPGSVPPRPAPFQGIILKPVPRAELRCSPSQDTASESSPIGPKSTFGAHVTKAESKPTHTPVLSPKTASVSSAVTQSKLASSLAMTRPHLGVTSGSVATQSQADSNLAVIRHQPTLVTSAVTRPQPETVTSAATQPQPETVTSAVTRPQPADVSLDGVPSAAPASGKLRWHQVPDSSMVFNFTKRQDVPDYVEDDGLIMRRKLPKAGDSGYVILPGFDPGQSCDDDLTSSLVAGPPSPCNVVFINADIIISGKSSLMKKPKARKMAVSFDVGGPSTHEYPSEASVEISIVGSNGSTGTNGTNGALGGLASYTPMAASSDFQLGVSRPTPPTPSRGGGGGGASAQAADEFLKPAEESETVAWSSEMSADILF